MDLKRYRATLRDIEEAMDERPEPVTSDVGSDGELLKTVPLPTHTDLLLSAQSTIE